MFNDNLSFMPVVDRPKSHTVVEHLTIDRMEMKIQELERRYLHHDLTNKISKEQERKLSK